MSTERSTDPTGTWYEMRPSALLRHIAWKLSLASAGVSTARARSSSTKSRARGGAERRSGRRQHEQRTAEREAGDGGCGQSGHPLALVPLALGVRLELVDRPLRFGERHEKRTPAILVRLRSTKNLDCAVARRGVRASRTRPSGPLGAARRLPSRVNAATSRVKNRRARAPRRGTRGVPAPHGKRGWRGARAGARGVESARSEAEAGPPVAPVAARLPIPKGL